MSLDCSAQQAGGDNSCNRSDEQEQGGVCQEGTDRPLDSLSACDKQSSYNDRLSKSRQRSTGLVQD